MNRLRKLVFGGRDKSARDLGPFVPRAIIFDFDGTIGDTFEAGFEILNALAPEFGYRALSREEIPRVRAMRTRELLNFLGVSTSKLPSLARRGSAELALRMADIQPLPGLPELIRELNNRGYPLGIITSNTEANVRTFLANHSLEHFSFIRSSSKLFGKAHEIRAALKLLGLSAREVLYIGDETRDIEACKKVGVPIAAVGWGYNAQTALQGLDPEFFVDNPNNLLDILPLLNNPTFPD